MRGHANNVVLGSPRMAQFVNQGSIVWHNPNDSPSQERIRTHRQYHADLAELDKYKCQIW